MSKARDEYLRLCRDISDCGSSIVTAVADYVLELEQDKKDLIDFMEFRMKTMDYKESDIFSKFLEARANHE